MLDLSRLPRIQKLQQYFRREPPRIFKLAVFLAHKKFSRAIDDRQGRYAFIERHLKFLGDIGVLLAVISNIDMHHFVALHDGNEIWPMKSQVENMAIETPV